MRENEPEKMEEQTVNPEQGEGTPELEAPEKNVNEEEKPLTLGDLTSGIERPEKGGRVCITYGRDQIMNKQVVSLIREFGITPVVMQDKTNTDKPIAQVYTENPDISFAIAILSADDWVYPKQGKPGDALMYADQRVVFHLGFWIGHLGRNNVFALYYDQKSFRWPTEHFDVIYTPLDKNTAWKKELKQRLKASGIEICED